METRARMINKVAFSLFFIFLMHLCCVQVEADEMMKSAENIPSIDKAAWEKVSRLKIFFGHQSVGNNIIDGLNLVAKKNQFQALNFVETRDGDDITKPIFAHSKIGKNKQPLTKIDDFVSIVKSGVGEKIDIALMKLCFVDIIGDTNIKELFQRYHMALQGLKREFPNVKFMAVTSPLTTLQSGGKALVKKYFFRSRSAYWANIKRYEFNEAVREAYSQSGMLFDIARAESTLSNGNRAIFIHKGSRYECLYHGYTNDGGHLNEDGKQWIVKNFIHVLSKSAPDELK